MEWNQLCFILYAPDEDHRRSSIIEVEYGALLLPPSIVAYII